MLDKITHLDLIREPVVYSDFPKFLDEVNRYDCNILGSEFMVRGNNYNELKQNMDTELVNEIEDKKAYARRYRQVSPFTEQDELKLKSAYSEKYHARVTATEKRDKFFEILAKHADKIMFQTICNISDKVIFTVSIGEYLDIRKVEQNSRQNQTEGVVYLCSEPQINFRNCGHSEDKHRVHPDVLDLYYSNWAYSLKEVIPITQYQHGDVVKDSLFFVEVYYSTTKSVQRLMCYFKNKGRFFKLRENGRLRQVNLNSEPITNVQRSLGATPPVSEYNFPNAEKAKEMGLISFELKDESEIFIEMKKLFERTDLPEIEQKRLFNDIREKYGV